MNSITITGQLGKDSERRALGDGTPVLSFSVADSQGKDKPTIWWNCSMFGKRADSLQQYLNKGQAVTVVGTASEREWTDKDGMKRKSMDVRVNDVALQGGNRESSSTAPAQRPTSQQAQRPASGFEDMDEDSVPF
jgi:single-strand DNA-binding protein